MGNTQKEQKNYLHPKHFFTQKVFQNSSAWVAALPNAVRKEIEDLRTSEIKYKKLDDSVLYAIFVSRKASQKAGWEQGDSFGVNFGSSRGATQLFEKYHTKFLEYATSSTPVSPLTTLGNLSSWVAHDLKSRGVRDFTFHYVLHSLTCGFKWSCMDSIRAYRQIFGWWNRSLPDRIYNCSNESYENLCQTLSKHQPF